MMMFILTWLLGVLTWLCVWVSLLMFSWWCGVWVVCGVICVLCCCILL